MLYLFMDFKSNIKDSNHSIWDTTKIQTFPSQPKWCGWNSYTAHFIGNTLYTVAIHGVMREFFVAVEAADKDDVKFPDVKS